MRLPPFSDSTFESGQLFFKIGDGPLIPLMDIQQAEIIDRIDEDPNFAIPSWMDCSDMKFTAKMTKQSAKQWKKLFRPYENRTMRMIRTWKRYKEKCRRASLKAGLKIWL